MHYCDLKLIHIYRVHVCTFKIFNEKRATQFQKCLYFGKCRINSLVLYCPDIEKLNDCYKMLNTLDVNLKFTMKIGGNSICFLDLKISIQNNPLERTASSKPGSHLYLEASSCPKKYSKNNISSTMETFKIKYTENMAYFVARRHSTILVKSEFEKVIGIIPRHEARKKVEKSFENKVIFTSIFNPRGPNVSQVINRHLHLIKNSPFLYSISPRWFHTCC